MSWSVRRQWAVPCAPARLRNFTFLPTAAAGWWAPSRQTLAPHTQPLSVKERPRSQNHPTTSIQVQSYSFSHKCHSEQTERRLVSVDLSKTGCCQLQTLLRPLSRLLPTLWPCFPQCGAMQRQQIGGCTVTDWRMAACHYHEISADANSFLQSSEALFTEVSANCVLSMNHFQVVYQAIRWCELPGKVPLMATLPSVPIPLP